MKYKLKFYGYDGEYMLVNDKKVFIPKYRIYVRGFFGWSQLDCKEFSAEDGMSAINLLIANELGIEKSEREMINGSCK